MWRGLLLFALVVGSIALVAPPNPHVGYPGPDQARPSQIRQAPTPAPPEVGEPPFYKQPCRNTPEDRQSDLCAQWEAADWTKWGVLVGILGTIALIYQIMLTREAVEDTSEATQEMRRANEIARETMQRQLRAYFDFNGVFWLWDGTTDVRDTPPTGFRVCIKNYGHTPGTQVVYTISHSATINGQALTIPNLAIAEHLHSISPTDDLSVNGDDLQMTQDVWNALKDGTAKFISHIVVTYEDAFEEAHTLKADFTNNSGRAEHSMIPGTRHAD